MSLENTAHNIPCKMLWCNKRFSTLLVAKVAVKFPSLRIYIALLFVSPFQPWILNILHDLWWLLVFIPEGEDEIDEGPIIETSYLKEKGEEYLGQVLLQTVICLCLWNKEYQ